jgi:hypothetical protein
VIGDHFRFGEIHVATEKDRQIAISGASEFLLQYILRAAGCAFREKKKSFAVIPEDVGFRYALADGVVLRPQDERRASGTSRTKVTRIETAFCFPILLPPKRSTVAWTASGEQSTLVIELLRSQAR